jgi:transcriptional regulator with XRE-family HTH domain
MITAQHLRMARAGLGWTLVDLGERADVNPNTIARYEAGREGMAGKLRKLETTLRAAGVMFIEEDAVVGVRLPLILSGKKAR